MRYTVLLAFGFLISQFSLQPLAWGQADYRAKHCEIYIERVLAYQEAGGVHGIQLYIKTLNSRLDGEIVKVGFFNFLADASGNASRICSSVWNSVEQSRLPDCDALSVWRELKLQPFFGARDYWVLDLPIGSNTSFPHVYEGSFFVETNRGTRYWLNTANGKDFQIDDVLLQKIDSALGRKNSSKNLENAIRTAEKLPYLNPGLCQG